MSNSDFPKNIYDELNELRSFYIESENQSNRKSTNANNN